MCRCVCMYRLANLFQYRIPRPTDYRIYIQIKYFLPEAYTLYGFSSCVQDHPTGERGREGHVFRPSSARTHTYTQKRTCIRSGENEIYGPGVGYLAGPINFQRNLPATVFGAKDIFIIVYLRLPRELSRYNPWRPTWTSEGRTAVTSEGQGRARGYMNIIPRSPTAGLRVSTIRGKKYFRKTSVLFRYRDLIFQI